MKNARHTTKKSGRVTTHLSAAIVLCASAAAPLAHMGGADRAGSSVALVWAALASSARLAPSFEAPVARPTFLRAERGPAAAVRSADGKVLGWTRDQVLEAATGRITHVLLETEAGRSVLVPAQRFAWDPQKKELWLAAGPAELSEGSEYDPAELQRLEGPAWNVAGVFQAGRITSREATPRNSAKNLLASEVVQRPVTVEGRAFGAVEALLTDPQRSEVAYLLVVPFGDPTGPGPAVEGPAGGGAPLEPILVPWSAVTSSEDGHLALEISAPRLAQAPTVPTDLVPMGNPGFLATVDLFYGSPDAEAGD